MHRRTSPPPRDSRDGTSAKDKRRQLPLAACRHATDREVIKRRDRISLRPQAHTAGSVATVVVIEIELAVEPRLDVIPQRHHPDRVPLPGCRRLDARGRQLTPASVVVVEAEVVLECIGTDHVVLAVVEPEHDPARGILAPRKRLEFHGDVDVGKRANRGNNDVEFVPHGALYKHRLAARCPGHFLNGPLSVHRRPAVEALAFEVELLLGRVPGQFQLLSSLGTLGQWTAQQRRSGQRENGATGDVQSSLSDTVFHSSPFTSVTSPTGWPSFNAGMTLTARYTLISFTASDAAASSDRLAFAIASL